VVRVKGDYSLATGAIDADSETRPIYTLTGEAIDANLHTSASA
jgi:hypothetical protein